MAAVNGGLQDSIGYKWVQVFILLYPLGLWPQTGDTPTAAPFSSRYRLTVPAPIRGPLNCPLKGICVGVELWNFWSPGIAPHIAPHFQMLFLSDGGWPELTVSLA